MTTVYDLPDDIQSSFLAGYEVPEMRAYELERERGALRKLAGCHPVPNAFEDGYSLMRAIVWVYSADTTREYNEDIAKYDELAALLNEKYGPIVLLSTEPGAKQAIGLRGCRKVQFGHVESGVRRDDGTFEITHRDLGAEIAAQDAIVRDGTRDATT